MREVLAIRRKDAPVLSADELVAFEAEIKDWVDSLDETLDSDATVAAAVEGTAPKTPFEISDYRFKSAAKRYGHEFEFLDLTSDVRPPGYHYELPDYLAACSCNPNWVEVFDTGSSRAAARRDGFDAWKQHVVADPYVDFKLDPVIVKQVVSGGLPSLGRRQ